ncbi:MAG: 2-hydroxyacyl-CoA dehydratase family protein [Candidatus Limivicinus sp.]|nr:2-hydroxyacyl-CoA dehydratase family protein [Candidatus Limivicinus sp.]
MRDLKHLIYFEDLLQDANNALVQKASADGRLALAYNCSYIPELLLDVEGCFGVRLRAPRCTNPDLATYYMTNRSCPYSKSILERAFEGGYNFIDALLGQECCTTMNRMEQYFDYCKLIPKEKFFISFIDMPLKKTEWHAGYFRRQIEQKIIEPLERVYGVDFSEEKLLAAIEQHNEVCRIISEIGDMRKLPNPPVTGYEFHVIQLVSLTCPKDLILPYLRETLEEIKQREPEPKFPFRARVMVAGSEIDDPDFTKLLESCGAYVVADRYCFGSIPGREEIIVRPGEDVLQAIADHYIQTNQCPRAMGPENVVARKQFLYKIAQEYGAEGVIVENMKFCEYWGYERAQAAQWMRDGFSLPGTLPVCQIEKDYTNAATGQLRTRFQAFVESLEIKRIQSER